MMKPRARLLLLTLALTSLAAALSPAGCGGDVSASSGGAGGTGGAAGVRYACDNRLLDSSCADYWSDATKTEVTGSCDGAVLEVRCPTEGAIGSCSLTANNGKLLTSTYYSSGAQPWTEATAMTACAMSSGTYKKAG
jgi:hypothetical protein